MCELHACTLHSSVTQVTQEGLAAVVNSTQGGVALGALASGALLQ